MRHNEGDRKRFNEIGNYLTNQDNVAFMPWPAGDRLEYIAAMLHELKVMSAQANHRTLASWRWPTAKPSDAVAGR
jgi:hypothetical protein